MITIYGRSSSINVQKAVWTAAELSLEVHRVDADGTIGSIDTPDYRKLNPFALVPTLAEDGLVLGQSLAIVRYLARKYGPGTLLPEDPDTAARADAWMEWGDSDFWVMQLRAVYWNYARTPEEKRDMNLVNANWEQCAEQLRIFEAELADRPFVIGDLLTIADIPAGCAISRYFRTPRDDFPDIPNIRAWYARLRDRPAYIELVDTQPY